MKIQTIVSLKDQTSSQSSHCADTKSVICNDNAMDMNIKNRVSSSTLPEKSAIDVNNNESCEAPLKTPAQELNTETNFEVWRSPRKVRNKEECDFPKFLPITKNKYSSRLDDYDNSTTSTVSVRCATFENRNYRLKYSSDSSCKDYNLSMKRERNNIVFMSQFSSDISTPMDLCMPSLDKTYQL